VGGRGLDLSGLGQGPVVGSCERSSSSLLMPVIC